MIYDLAQDAVAFLTDFSETVTYHPASGESRQIKAVVDRSPPADLPGAPAGALAPKATIAVANRATAISDDTIGVACTATVDGTIKYHDAGGTKRSGTMSIMAKGGHAIGYSGNAIMPAIMFGTNVKPQVDLVTCNIGGVGLYAIVSV